MKTEKTYQSTAEYWATVDRIGDGDTVPTTQPPQHRSLWQPFIIATGALLIFAVIIGTLR